MSCDKAKRESRKLLHTCKRLQKSLDIYTKRYQELEGFIEQITCKRVNFNAFRCLEVDRKAIVMLITITSNYFIVIVQFLNTK